MADEVDVASNSIEVTTNAAIAAILRSDFEKGFAGECDLCGYEKARLVHRVYENERVAVCGGCRDEYGLDS